MELKTVVVRNTAFGRYSRINV